jgi:rhamnosyltransferase
MQVWAVIVTYNPALEPLRDLLSALAGEDIAGIVVVDNGSIDFPEDALGVAVAPIEIRRLSRNRGIGAAHNEGIRIARLHNAAYVLLLDQDSVPEPGMVAALKRAVERLRDQGRKVGCVGPRLRARGSEELSTFRRLAWWPVSRCVCADENDLIECDDVVSSGSLIPFDALASVGDMEEELFIDHVDSEWCWRARSKGFETYGVCSAVLQHRLGEGNCRIWLGRWRNVFRHRPLRYYYIFRNTISLFRRHYMPSRWVVFQLARLVILFLAFGLGAEGASATRRMMWKGTRDGLRGVTGPLNESSP